MTTDCYNTIAQDGVAEIREKSSRFIAYAYRVTELCEVEQIIAKLRAEHHAARHHCYAWRIGANGALNRSNDDGEPSGTAGRPIMGQLISADISDVMVVVVRYFGGILLGTSGLIAAYREATAAVIAKVGVEEKVLRETLEVKVDYQELEQVMKVVKRCELKIEPIQYQADKCLIKIEVRKSQRQQIEEEIIAPKY